MTNALFQLNRRPAGIGLLLAVVALAMQLAAGSLVPRASISDSVDQLIASAICHADSDIPTPNNAPAQHHAPDCAVCPICQAMAQAPMLLSAPMAVLLAPVLRMAASFILPPARAPPGRPATAASARGPPATI
jgi:hypothetical protein